MVMMSPQNLFSTQVQVPEGEKKDIYSESDRFCGVRMVPGAKQCGKNKQESRGVRSVWRGRFERSEEVRIGTPEE